MSIFLSAGHSKTDPGAVADGVKEADIAAEFRNLVAFYLHREKAAFEADGSAQENLPLTMAAALARRHDVAVEFHCNAAASPKATGVETLSGPKRMNLGEQLCQAISQALDLPSRGAKAENSGQHSRLAFVQAGGVIVELFFITNPGDLAAYQSRKWVAAKAVAEALMEYDK